MKNILILNYEFPPLGGGASPVSYEISKGYVNLGYNVDVITMGYKDLPSFEVQEGINIHRVKCIRSKKEMCYPWEQMSYLIFGYKKAKQLIAKKKFDVCHCHFVIPTGALAYKIYKKFQIPYIITAHGSDIPGFNTDRFQLLHKFTPFFLKKIINNSKYTISPSIYLQNLIKKNLKGVNTNKLLHIPNGIYPDKFIPGKKEKIILGTGRLLERKGFQYLSKAFSELENVKGYELHICGDGPMMKKLKEIQKKSRNKIVLHGWIDNNGKTYKKLLETASIYCLASEKENASISLLEAMSGGCSIITTNVSGCPETIGKDGFLVNPKNSNEIKKHLDFLMKNDKIVKEKGNLMRKRLEENFDWGEIINIYNNIFINLS